MILNFHLIGYEGQFRYLGLLILRNILSRYLIEFKIPLVIHCDNLCLCFLNFTVLGARCLAFAFTIISSKC